MCLIDFYVLLGTLLYEHTNADTELIDSHDSDFMLAVFKSKRINGLGTYELNLLSTQPDIGESALMKQSAGILSLLPQ